MTSDSMMTSHTSSSAPARARLRTQLVLLNVLGGLSVLGTYAYGAVLRPEAMGALWGGVPDALRPLYTINMFLAAAGYFLFAPYIVLRLDPVRTRIGERFGYALFLLLFALVLIPSALWLPLTMAMVAAPSLGLWWAIRLALGAVAVGAIGLLLAVWKLDADAPAGRVRAAIGLVPFVFQTAVLDGLIWPAYFPLAL